MASASGRTTPHLRLGKLTLKLDLRFLIPVMFVASVVGYTDSGWISVLAIVISRACALALLVLCWKLVSASSRGQGGNHEG